MAASYLAAPRISEEEEAEEKASLTDTERLEALSDLYGLLPIPPSELEALSDPGIAHRAVAAAAGSGRSSSSGSSSDGNGEVASSSGGGSSSLLPKETEEDLERYLRQLDGALQSILDDADAADRNGEVDVTLKPCASSPAQSVRISTTAYREAVAKCPHLVLSRDHRLLFLRAEYHSPPEAAVRMFRYWSDRTDLFGDGAYGSLLPPGADALYYLGHDDYRWDGAITDPIRRMQSDAVELGIGYPRLSPERDESGRALLIFDQSVVKKRSAYDRAGMRRALFYRIHLALRDVRVQRAGLVLIGLGYGQIDQLDRKLDVSLWRTIRDVLPARIVASHFVYGTNRHMRTLIAPNIKFFFGKNARARLREYTGNESDIIEKLKRFGIPASALPKEVGGGWTYDASSCCLMPGLTVDQIKAL